MRFLRALFQYFLNNEHLINKLAESKPIRQSAQFVVYILIKTGMMHGTRRTISSPRDFVKQLQDIAQQLKKQLEETKNEFKKNPPK
jgi:flagellar biosynthesis protein FlhB